MAPTPSSHAGGAKTSEQPGLRDRGMRWACRSGSAVTVHVAVRLGASVSAVPVRSVAAALAASRPVGLVGAPGASLNATGDVVTVKALTLELAAKGRQVDTFAPLVSLGGAPRRGEEGAAGGVGKCLEHDLMFNSPICVWAAWPGGSEQAPAPWGE